jgi:hypothetical protein
MSKSAPGKHIEPLMPGACVYLPLFELLLVVSERLDDARIRCFVRADDRLQI